jgi:LPXTG-site transpeptidase (sortase) family protein
VGFVAFDALVWQQVIAYAATPVVKSNIVPPAVIVIPKAYGRIGVPVRLTIASIAVHAPIEQVALTKAGAMGIPKEPMNAAWFSLGPRPGEPGSAVIDGHLNWYQGATGVFRDLRKLKAGDTIVVTDDAGTEISFVVRELRAFAAGADSTDVFRSTDDGAHLNLITCDGTWDSHAKQYSKRLVVFTDRVKE